MGTRHQCPTCHRIVQQVALCGRCARCRARARASLAIRAVAAELAAAREGTMSTPTGRGRRRPCEKEQE